MTWSAATTVLRDQALSPTGQEVDIANVAMILWYLNGETKAPINKFIVKQPAWGARGHVPSLQRTAGLETEVTPRFMGSILGSASRTPQDRCSARSETATLRVLMEGAQQRVDLREVNSLIYCGRCWD
ncbi:MAG: hypothetical protein ACREV4_12055 [Gammaproteobacteria bacterium]